MTYDEKITELRNQSGDTRRRIHVDFIGDGATTIFQLPADTFPVLDEAGTYSITVNGSPVTEGSDYTFYKNEGTLSFNTAPTDGHAITLDGSAVYLTNEDWMDVINSSIRSLGDDFWKEFVDESSFTATAAATSVSLVAGRPNCIAVYEFQRKLTVGDNWTTVETYTNWRFDRENNIIYVGRNDVFGTEGELLRVRGLEGYTLGEDTDDDIDVQSRFHTIIDFGSLSRYYQYRYKNVIELVSKMSTENTRTPLQELMMLADRFSRQYEIEKAKLKPQKPSRVIPRYKEGGGRP